MNKTQKTMIWIFSFYAAFLIGLSILISVMDWSWWWLFWMFIIPLVLIGSGYLAVRVKKKPKIEQEKPKIPKDKVEKEAERFVMNHEYLADMPTHIKADLYVPEQEGENKVSYWKVRVERYNNEDILFLATKTDKLEFEISQEYQLGDENAENDFNMRLQKAVVNPERQIETEDIITDPSGAQRTIKRKTPAEYLKLAQQRRETKQVEEEEGAE